MMCHSAAMAFKNKFLFIDLVFTGKNFNGVHFHSNEGKSTSALIAVELPSPLLGVASSGLITVALEHSAVPHTGN